MTTQITLPSHPLKSPDQEPLAPFKTPLKVGVTAYYRGNHPLAHASLTQSIESSTLSTEDWVHALYTRGKALASLQLWDFAIADYSLSIPKASSDGIHLTFCLFHRALAYETQGNLVKALEDYNRAVDASLGVESEKFARMRSRVRLFRGCALKALCESAHVLEDFKSVDFDKLKIKEGTYCAPLIRAKVALAKKTLSEVIVESSFDDEAEPQRNPRTMASQYKPARSPTLSSTSDEEPPQPVNPPSIDKARQSFHAGLTAYRQKNYPLAMAHFTQGIESGAFKRGERVTIGFWRGKTLAAMQLFDFAIPEYDHSLQNAALQTKVVYFCHFHRGIAYECTGKIKLALRDYHNAVQGAKHHNSAEMVTLLARARLFRGCAYASLNKITKAVQGLRGLNFAAVDEKEETYCQLLIQSKVAQAKKVLQEQEAESSLLKHLGKRPADDPSTQDTSRRRTEEPGTAAIK